MSNFLGGLGIADSTAILQGNDERVNPTTYQWYGRGKRSAQAQWTDGFLWPSSRMLSGDNGVPLVLFGQDAAQDSQWEAMPEENLGTPTMKKIIGTTRDANGNPLGSCVVKGFLTASNLFLRQMTSDGAGYYEFCSEYSGATHYLVAYLVGSPDVEGTTVNTLVPV